MRRIENSLHNPSMKKDPGTRICIIGAGAAGLSAAYFLKENGYQNVTVLERDSSVGGKCRSLRVDGINHDMGAVEFTPFYRNTLSLMKKLGVAHARVAPMNLVDSTTFQFMDIWMLFGNAGIVTVARAIFLYLFHLIKNGKYLRKPGYHVIPGDLARPFDDWLGAHGMKAIRNLFIIPLTCYGYGRLKDIPAVYVLKYVNFSNMVTMIKASILKMCRINYGWPRRVADGFQRLFEELEKTLDDVRRDVRITGIARNGKSEGSILVNLAGETDPLEFDDLIVAFPPETGAMASMGFDMSPDEKKIFDAIIHQPYFTTACRVKGLEPGIHLTLVKHGRIEVPGNGSPLLVYRQTEKSDVAVVYTSLGSDDVRDEPVISREIHDAIVRTLSGTGMEVEILETRRWDYFPHVGTAELRGGFYEKLVLLQGLKNTYYTGALLNFESVEHVVEYSKRLVDEYY